MATENHTKLILCLNSGRHSTVLNLMASLVLSPIQCYIEDNANYISLKLTLIFSMAL